MRGFFGAVAALLVFAGQAQAAPLAPADIGGRWRDPGGTCEDFVVHAVELGHTAQNEPTLFGVVKVGADMVAGDVILDGPRKGKLISQTTGKPAVQFTPAKGKLKIAPIDKSSGVKAATLEACPGTRPDFARADAMSRELSGAWFEVTETGDPASGYTGKATCQSKSADPTQRGALAFKWADDGRMTFSQAGVLAYTDWKSVELQPETVSGSTWLKMNLSRDNTPRLVAFMTIAGTYRLRMVVIDPKTRRSTYYETCQ